MQKIMPTFTQGFSTEFLTYVLYCHNLLAYSYYTVHSQSTDTIPFATPTPSSVNKGMEFVCIILS